jgi:uncharacterized membrane protein YebE (DUF533 family)
MLDAKSLLEKFLGPDVAGRAAGGVQQASNAANQVMGRVGLPTSGMGGLAVGAGAAGLLGLLLGGKGMKKGLGKVATYGGAAALGALAYRAFQNYQGQPAPAPVAPDVSMAPPPQYLPGAAPAADGTPFELALIRAMVGAAKSDGHIDAAEQARIFQAVERAGLDAEAKAFVFDVLNKPADPAAIAAAATTREQAAELYLASRMAIDPDNPAERAYLDALTHRLNLPQPLVAQLDAQVTAAG